MIHMVLYFVPLVPPISPEYQAESNADQYTGEACKEKQQGTAGAFFSTEKTGYNTACGRCGNNRFEHPVYQHAAEQIAQGNGEKLKRIATGIDTPLHLRGYRATEDNVHVCVHERYHKPAEHRAGAPNCGAISESEHEVLDRKSTRLNSSH